MSIKENLDSINRRISDARLISPTPDADTKLVAVSKYHTLEEIKSAYDFGQRVFGENRVQELLPKIEAMQEYKDVEWHLIGHLQKNKVRQVVGKVALIQSVDSVGLADEIEKRAAQHEIDVNILIQVNVAGEEQKSGMPFEQIDEFISNLEKWPHIYIKGLMFIAPNFENKDELRPYFKKLFNKFQSLKTEESAHLQMKWLSMGMSGDFEYAIQEGANMVRVGSAVFNVE